MNTLIIFAHPGTVGHNSYILELIKKELESKKESFEVLDLYKMNFDPVLKSNELYSSKNRQVDESLKKIQDKIFSSSKLIFIYPVWWNGAPAILKGFFDRVFSSRFAFKYVKILKRFNFPNGLLKGKKAAIFITTGSPKIISWLIQGFGGGNIVKKDILKFSGIKSKFFHYGPALKFSDESKPKLEKLVKKGLNWLY